MPRLKQSKVPYESLIKVFMANGITSGSAMARVLGVSPPTGSKLMRYPDQLTLGNLYRIHRVVGIPWEEIRGAITR